MLQIFLKINIKKKIECAFESIMREYTNLSFKERK